MKCSSELVTRCFDVRLVQTKAEKWVGCRRCLWGCKLSTDLHEMQYNLPIYGNQVVALMANTADLPSQLSQTNKFWHTIELAAQGKMYITPCRTVVDSTAPAPDQRSRSGSSPDPRNPRHIIGSAAEISHDFLYKVSQRTFPYIISTII